MKSAIFSLAAACTIACMPLRRNSASVIQSADTITTLMPEKIRFSTDLRPSDGPLLEIVLTKVKDGKYTGLQHTEQFDHLQNKDIDTVKILMSDLSCSITRDSTNKPTKVSCLRDQIADSGDFAELLILSGPADVGFDVSLRYANSNPAHDSTTREPEQIAQGLSWVQYPVGPDSQLTPGLLCEHSDTHRYPEGIAYCERDVNTGLKEKIIRAYDNDLGFAIEATGRPHFKIDHYIPLCVGGSNDEKNLWPQHESSYALTDPLEPLACEKMAEGLLLQAKAVELIFKAKNDFSKIPEVMDYLDSL